MSESISSKESRRSHPESSSNSNEASPGGVGVAKPPRFISGSPRANGQTASASPDRSFDNESTTNNSSRKSTNQQSPNNSDDKHKRKPLPTWCYIPPKEGHSTLKKNVLLFGKTVDVYWCPHHERWDKHRLRDCPIEVKFESFKQQLELSSQDKNQQVLLESTLAKLNESEQKVKNQRSRLTILEQKIRDANGTKSLAGTAETTTNSTTTMSLDDFMNRKEPDALKNQLQTLQDELEETRQRLQESEARLKKMISKRNNEGEQTTDELEDLQRRLDMCLKKSENRKSRIVKTESNYKQAKERLKEEQELRKHYKKELDAQSKVNRSLERQLQEASNEASFSRNNGGYDRREETDKSIYRLSESLATITGALESERAARMTLEREFGQERKDYEEKLQDARAQLERSQMLLVAKRQTSGTMSTSSFRSNGHYVKICRTFLYSHNMVDDEKVQLVKETASELNIGGFIKGGRPGLIVVEGLEEDCDAFLNALAKQHRKQRESPSSRNGKVDSATFAAAGKVISQADTLDEGRAFPKELTQLDNEGGLDELKALCASTGLLDLIDEVCNKR
jgi:hypothetical protein